MRYAYSLEYAGKNRFSKYCRLLMAIQHGPHFSDTFSNKIDHSFSNEYISSRGRLFHRAVAALEIFPWPNFTVDLGHKIGNILKNGFNQRFYAL